MDSTLKYFKNIEDPRSDRNKKHPLMMLIGTTLLASLAGIDSFSGFSHFTEAHLEHLEQYFNFPYGVPSHDTYQRLWDAISPEEFYQSFEVFTQDLASMRSSLVSLDGKTIRRSGHHRPLHIVSAWCHENSLILAHQKVDEGDNEISTLPKLISLLDLNHRIVTIDAIGAQRKICAQIIEKGGDYVISLKGNQGDLHHDVKGYFEEKSALNKYASSEESDKGHGRTEQRKAYSCDQIEWLQKMHQWPGLKSIGMVTSKVEKRGKTSKEERFYISSLPANARLLNKAARSHWGIENKLHWRLDVVFNEDGACIRNDNAAENVDVARKWALNVLQKTKEKPSQSIKSIMRKNAMSFKYLLKTIDNIFHA